MVSKSESDIADEYPPSSQDDLDLERGRFISQHVHLETQLSNVFCLGYNAWEGNTVYHDRAVHGTFVFYKIISSRTRSDILKEIIKNKCKMCKDIFIKSLFNELNEIDNFRNKVAHWERCVALGTDGQQRYFLTKPRHSVLEESISPGHMADFIIRMRFSYYLFCIVWQHALENYYSWAPREACEKIFHQKVVYPPSPDHPLIPTWNGPTAPKIEGRDRPKRAAGS